MRAGAEARARQGRVEGKEGLLGVVDLLSKPVD